MVEWPVVFMIFPPHFNWPAVSALLCHFCHHCWPREDEDRNCYLSDTTCHQPLLLTFQWGQCATRTCSLTSWQLEMAIVFSRMNNQRNWSRVFFYTASENWYLQTPQYLLSHRKLYLAFTVELLAWYHLQHQWPQFHYAIKCRGWRVIP